MPDTPKLNGRHVFIPLDTAIYHEFILRTGNPECDVAGIIENVVLFYLERTADDFHIWTSDQYQSERSEDNSDEIIEEYGNPSRGYRWSQLFLANGTQLKMTYKGRTHHAEVRHEQLVYEGKPYSPSQLACTIADNTSRNAWRDLWVKRPTDKEWRLATELRRAG